MRGFPPFRVRVQISDPWEFHEENEGLTWFDGMAIRHGKGLLITLFWPMIRDGRVFHVVMATRRHVGKAVAQIDPGEDIGCNIVPIPPHRLDMPDALKPEAWIHEPDAAGWTIGSVARPATASQ